MQHLIRDIRRVRRHEIDRIDRTQDDCIIVSALVTHDADGAHVGKRREILSDRFIHSCAVHFLAVNGIRFLDDFYFFFRDLTDDADAESRTRERLTHDKFFRNPEMKSYLPYLILEQVAQRLDDFLEINIVRKSADIVVRFDDGRFTAQSAFHDVRINSALYQIIHRSDFLRFFFEDAYEFLADDFSLFFGFRHA